MAVTVFIKPMGARLIAANPAAELAIADIKSGLWKADLSMPRNAKRHRLYWALCGTVAKCMNDGPGGPRGWTAEGVDAELRIGTGYCKPCHLPPHLVKLTGYHVGVLKTSISFSNMDDSEFITFMNDAIDYVRRHLVSWLPKNDWRKQVLEMAGVEETA